MPNSHLIKYSMKHFIQLYNYRSYTIAQQPMIQCNQTKLLEKSIAMRRSNMRKYGEH